MTELKFDIDGIQGDRCGNKRAIIDVGLPCFCLGRTARESYF